MTFATLSKTLLALLGLACLSASSLLAAEPTVAELIAATQKGDDAARVKAIDALGEMHAAEAVEALSAVLRSGSPAVKAHAAHALGQIGAAAKPAAEALAGLLKEEDATLRREAVKALIAIHPGPKVMIPIMAKLLADSDNAVRTRILHAAAEAGPAAVPGLIEALDNDKVAYWACLVLREIGPAAKDAAPALAKKLTATQPELRREAALTLAVMGDAATPYLPDLAKALGDEHAATAATFALGQLGKLPEGAEAKIMANAESKDVFLSTVSYWTLARMKPDDKELRKKATEKLVARIMDKDPFIRVAAARALASLPPAPDITLPIWENALKGADEQTALHAMDALATMGPAAVPRLIDVLKHKKLRGQAAYILGQIGPAAAPATGELAKLLSDSDARVATEAALAIAKIGAAAKDAVPALSAAVTAKDSPNAHAAAYALGKLGPAAMSAAPALATGMTSKDQPLAVLCAGALAKIESPSAAVAAKVLPTLTAGLAAEAAETRQAAASSIGGLGPFAKAALPALERAAAKDSSESVRAAAAAALKAVRGDASK